MTLARTHGPRALPKLANLARVVAPPAAVVILAGVMWQVVAQHNPDAFPTLGAIWRELVDHPQEYFANAGITLEEMGIGFALSVSVAFLLALVMSEVPLLERAVMPLAIAINVTPVVSFAPALVIVFGFGLMPRFIVAAIVVFFPFLINALTGLRRVDKDALDFLATVHASKLEVLYRLRLPSALPFLFAGARICVPLALVGAVVAEFTASSSAGGLGAAIVVANANSRLPAIYAAVACLAAIGLVLSGVVVLLERRVLSWRPHA